MVGIWEAMRLVFLISSYMLIVAPKEEILDEIIFVINGIPTTKQEFLDKYKKAKLHWKILRRSGVQTGTFPAIKDFASSVVEDILVQQEVDSQSVKVRDEDVINHIRTSIMEPQKITSLEDFKTALVMQGLDWDYFFQEQRKRMYQTVFLEKIADIKDPTQGEIKEYYQQHAKEYVVRGKLLRVSQIFLTIPEGAKFSDISQLNKQIEILRTQIISGEKKFSDVAKRYFQNHLFAEKGGDVGWIGSEDFSSTDATWKSINMLKKGEVSNVVHLPNGFAIFKIENMLTSGPIPFERAKKIIKYKLRDRAAVDAYKQKIQELRIKSTVNIYTDMFGKMVSL